MHVQRRIAALSIASGVAWFIAAIAAGAYGLEIALATNEKMVVVFLPLILFLWVAAIFVGRAALTRVLLWLEAPSQKKFEIKWDDQDAVIQVLEDREVYSGSQSLWRNFQLAQGADPIILPTDRFEVTDSADFLIVRPTLPGTELGMSESRTHPISRGAIAA